MRATRKKINQDAGKRCEEACHKQPCERDHQWVIMDPHVFEEVFFGESELFETVFHKRNKEKHKGDRKDDTEEGEG